jgi:hypothetical protein
VQLLFTACLAHGREMQNFGMKKFIFRKVNIVEIIQQHEQYCDVELLDQMKWSQDPSQMNRYNLKNVRHDISIYPTNRIRIFNR